MQILRKYSLQLAKLFCVPNLMHFTLNVSTERVHFKAFPSGVASADGVRLQHFLESQLGPLGEAEGGLFEDDAAVGASRDPSLGRELQGQIVSTTMSN